MRRIVTAFCLALALGPPLHAGTLAGVTLPDAAEVATQRQVEDRDQGSGGGPHPAHGRQSRLSTHAEGA